VETEASGRCAFSSSTSVRGSTRTCSHSPRHTRPSTACGFANESLQKRLEATITDFLLLAEAEKRYPSLKTAWVEFLGERPEPIIDRVE
jgi:hypothetical protein